MTEILMRILNIAERVRGMEQLSRVAAAAFAVLFIFGFLNCILGYRILRFWMMLFGFGMGAGLGLAAAYSVGVGDKMTYLIVMAATGIVLAVVSFLIYRAGIFILGAGIGMALSIYVLHPTTSAVFFLCILIGVGLGALAMRYAREVIIVGTSLLGGVLAGLSLAQLGSLPEIPYGIAMSAGFAALGMLVQFALNKPEKDSEETDIDDDADDGDYDADDYDTDDYDADDDTDDYDINDYDTDK